MEMLIASLTDFDNGHALPTVGDMTEEHQTILFCLTRLCGVTSIAGNCCITSINILLSNLGRNHLRVLVVTSLFSLNKINMIVIKDLINCVFSSGETEKAFTKHVNHRKLSELCVFSRDKKTPTLNQMQNAWRYLRTSLCP